MLSRGLQRALRLSGEEGAALVEMAVIVPLMLLVLTEAVSFSLAV